MILIYYIFCASCNANNIYISTLIKICVQCTNTDTTKCTATKTTCQDYGCSTQNSCTIINKADASQVPGTNQFCFGGVATTDN